MDPKACSCGTRRHGHKCFKDKEHKQSMLKWGVPNRGDYPKMDQNGWFVIESPSTCISGWFGSKPKLGNLQTGTWKLRRTCNQPREVSRIPVQILALLLLWHRQSWSLEEVKGKYHVHSPRPHWRWFHPCAQIKSPSNTQNGREFLNCFMKT